MKNSIKLRILIAGALLITALSTIASAADYPWNYTNPADAGAMFGVGLLAFCAIIAIIWFIVFILIAIWVYKDAEKRGKSGVLWLIIVIILGLIGIIIWLAIRPPIGGEKPASSRNCPNCGRGIPEDARSCPYCNKKFEE